MANIYTFLMRVAWLFMPSLAEGYYHLTKDHGRCSATSFSVAVALPCSFQPTCDLLVTQEHEGCPPLDVQCLCVYEPNFCVDIGY